MPGYKSKSIYNVLPILPDLIIDLMGQCISAIDGCVAQFCDFPADFDGKPSGMPGVLAWLINVLMTSEKSLMRELRQRAFSAMRSFFGGQDFAENYKLVSYCTQLVRL